MLRKFYLLYTARTKKLLRLRSMMWGCCSLPGLVKQQYVLKEWIFSFLVTFFCLGSQFGHVVLYVYILALSLKIEGPCLRIICIS